MSDRTPEQEEAQLNLQEAIEVWAEAFGFAGQGAEGALVNDWYIIGTSIWMDQPQRTLYWHGFRGGSQPPHVTAGLLRYGVVHNDADMLDTD